MSGQPAYPLKGMRYEFPTLSARRHRAARGHACTRPIDVATEKQLPLALALEAAQGALDQCRKDGFRVSVTVLNNAAQPIVLLRDGGTGPHTADTSRRKAYTSLTFRAPTTALSKRLAETRRSPI